MQRLLSGIGDGIVAFGDFICGYPLFILLIGGGLFFLIYSRFAPFRLYGRAIDELRRKDESGSGQISSVEALASTIAATVGMGNIAGVAIAISVGGPGAIFWMWVSTIVGMATKLFEGTISVMYKGRDSAGEMQGGPMYIITSALGPKWRPLAVFFCCFGLVGTLCVMQSNQLTESIITVFAPKSGDNILLRGCIGLIISVIVAGVIFGGIRRISNVATRLVPVMVAVYFLLIIVIIASHLSSVPGVFRDIFAGAFNLRAGAGGVAGSIFAVALTGVRRAAMVNEAGIGTASMMHGASKSGDPAREGLVAMIGPSIDSGLVCTLTAIAILTGRSIDPTIIPDGGFNSVQGLRIALNAFDVALPFAGSYLLFTVAVCFAFSTMFSYSYYGQKCLGFLLGADKAKLYNWLFLVMLVVAAMIPLRVAVSLIDIAFAMMAFSTMPVLIYLSPKAKLAIEKYSKTSSKNIR